MAATKGSPSRPRQLKVIAAEIAADWKKPTDTAAPLLAAMSQLVGLHDRYIVESAERIVESFLTNAGVWRGDVAKRVKAELRSALHDYRLRS